MVLLLPQCSVFAYIALDSGCAAATVQCSVYKHDPKHVKRPWQDCCCYTQHLWSFYLISIAAIFLGFHALSTVCIFISCLIAICMSNCGQTFFLLYCRFGGAPLANDKTKERCLDDVKIIESTFQCDPSCVPEIRRLPQSYKFFDKMNTNIKWVYIQWCRKVKKFGGASSNRWG